MRRTQPETATFILTGFPAFESALEAIRRQVDDFFVKPANVESIVSRIRTSLNSHPSQRQKIPALRLPSILEEHKREIFHHWMEHAKVDDTIRSAGLSDGQIADHLPVLIDEIITASSDLALSHNARVAAQRHGRARSRQGYTVVAMIREAHILHGVLCRIVQENLLRADISFLVTDIMRICEAVQAFLEESLHAYVQGYASSEQLETRET